MTTTQIAPLGYDTKSAAYFQELRPEMMPFVPSGCRRLLDVGCGAGGFGESLKRSRKIEVWGVEPVESAAEQATTKLDRVFHGTFDAEAGLPTGTFDCVMFNDVLEHMVAPEKALSYARTLLASGGAVVASIPNIRSLPAIWQVMVHGRWEYEDCGLFDRTHLRFFTKSSIVNMFEREAFELETLCGINAYVGFPNASRRLWAAYRVMNTLFCGKFGDMKFQQFAVVAKPAQARSETDRSF